MEYHIDWNEGMKTPAHIMFLLFVFQVVISVSQAMLEWPEYINSPLQNHIEEKMYQKAEDNEEDQDDVEMDSFDDESEECFDEESVKNKSI